MALKKLEIIGFKSFAKKTEIRFSKGINAIVGPNGCGKSNIVDAFLWALGEQSAKTLRGSKMHDVIFAGSEKHKAVHFAEVAITFDNSDNYLPVAFDEVSVLRRLYRDESSEYELNKQSVRLRDVQDLFASTGLGHETFAVIGQGRVGAIISQSAYERRAMFEEVAGVLHFLIKRKESERKLELAELNVNRAQDILKEVQAQKELLEKQAQDAKKYQRDQERLIASERRLVQVKLEQAERAYIVLVDALRAETAVKVAHEKKELEAKTRLASKKEQVKAVRPEVTALRDKLHELESSRALALKESAYSDEQAIEYQKKCAASQKESAGLEERLQEVQKEKQAVQASDELFQQVLVEKKQLYEEAEARFRLVSEGFTKGEARVKELYATRFSLQSQQQALDVERKKSVLAQEVAQEKHRERTNSISEHSIALEKLLETLAVKKEAKAAAISRVSEKKAALELISRQILELDTLVKTAGKEQEECRRSFVEKETRCKVLERQLTDLEGFSGAAKTLCVEAKKPGSSLQARVLALLDCFDGDSHPAFSLIGSLYESTLVVKTFSDLEECLTKLTKKQQVSFVVLEFLGLVDAAETSFSEKEKKAVREHLLQVATLRDCFDTTVSKTLPALIQDRFVDSFGVVHIGREKEHNMLDRKRQVKALKEELSHLQLSLNQLEEKLALFQKNRAEQAALRMALDEEMRKLDFDVVSTNFETQELEKQRAHIEKELDRYRSEIKSFETLLKDLKEQQVAVDVKLAVCSEELASAMSEVGSLEEEHQRHKREYDGLMLERNKALGVHHEAKTELQKVQHALELLHNQEDSLAKRLSFFLKEQELAEQSHKASLAKKSTAMAALDRLKVERNRFECELEKKQQSLGGVEREMMELEEALSSLQGEREAFVSHLSAKEVERQHLLAEKKQYAEALQLLPEAKEAVDETLSVEQLEALVRRLRGAVDRGSQVNLLAIDELELAKKRLEELQSQLADLASAKEELVAIVQQLEQQSTTAFKETFEAIRSSFIRHFQTLFNGGEADLVLTEGRDLLQAGIEIVARPPGKQMRSMQLLSGGEKSLTALALLFACFDVRPAPFCILDEVDAALDEANVERLGNLLASFAGKLQFLVITHNKRTMARADTLIGVSMQQKGVSEIISLEFSHEASSVEVGAAALTSI